MNTKTTVAGVAAAALIGFVAFNQVGYQERAKQDIEHAVKQINQSNLAGEEYRATLISHDGSLFSSSGEIRVETGPSYLATQFNLTYTINHGLLTLLTGASYEAEILNSMMRGDSERTITSEFFAGNPITLQGSMGSDSMDGTLKVPEIAFTERENRLAAEPMEMTFSVSHFDESGNPDHYTVNTHIPTLEFNERRTNLTFQNGTFSLNSERNGDQGSANAQLDIEQLALTKTNYYGDQRRTEIKGFTAKVDSELKEQLVGDITLTLDQASANSQTLSDVVFNYAIDGLDGPTLIKLDEMLQKAIDDGWSTRDLENALFPLLLAHSDTLLAHNPRLTIKRFKADMNGELLIDAEGYAKLDAAKLPEDFVKESLQNHRPDPQVVLNALLVDFKAELGQEVFDNIRNVNVDADQVLPQDGNIFTFQMSDGEATLNGEKI